MLVKILDADPELIQLLKSHTGQTTASKALIEAAKMTLSLDRQVRELRDSQRLDRQRLDSLTQGIDNARSSAEMLIGKLSQRDLLG